MAATPEHNAETYDLTLSWLSQIGQGLIQAASALRSSAQDDFSAGRLQDAYLKTIGAELAMQIQAMPPDERHTVPRDVPLGQYVATVVVSGDVSDPQGLAGFNDVITDTDPGRTALIAAAHGFVGQASADAGNTMLAFLDQCPGDQ